MRRHFLIAAAALTSVAGTAAIGAPKTVSPHRRLLGSWKSDAERTMKYWQFRKQPDPEAVTKFAAIFGKMTWRITAKNWDGEYEGKVYRATYEVIASDSRSVIVRHSGSKEFNAELKQYFFDEENYLYVASGFNFEFFRRVEA